MDYLKLNDGLDDPVLYSPKPKRIKPYSPPPREGPSATRQAAHKRKSDQNIADDSMKLPDLVTNSAPPKTLNGGTTTSALHKSAHIQTKKQGRTSIFPTTADAEINIEQPQEHAQAMSPLSSEPMLPSVPVKSNAEPMPEPLGHDTCSTTDEEDAIEALLALGELPDTSSRMDELNENEHLMPIGIPNPGTDISPVEIKLGTDDVTQAIADLPDENRFKPLTPPPHEDDNARARCNNI